MSHCLTTIAALIFLGLRPWVGSANSDIAWLATSEEPSISSTSGWRFTPCDMEPAQWGSAAYGLRLSLRFHTNTFVPSAPIEALVVLRNVSSVEAVFFTSKPEYDWDFLIIDEHGQQVPMTRNGWKLLKGYAWSTENTNEFPVELPFYRPGKGPLPAGRQRYFTLDLSKNFDLSKSGRYLVTVARNLHFQDSPHAEIHSNTEQITIVRSGTLAEFGVQAADQGERHTWPHSGMDRSGVTASGIRNLAGDYRPASGNDAVLVPVSIPEPDSNEAKDLEDKNVAESFPRHQEQLLATSPNSKVTFALFLALVPGAYAAWWLLRRRQR
jgi:hypothetical protein